MWDFLGGGIGALGSIYGASVQKDIANQNAQTQMMINAQNIAEQEKFAQTGIQWKVADAKAAGINPLAALGASTQSFSNVVAPQTDPRGIGSLYGQAGQSLGRAISSIQSPEDKAIDQAQKLLSLQKDQAQIDLIRSQATAVQGHAGIGGAGNPPGVPAFSEQGVKAGVPPAVQMAQTPSGHDTPIPPHEIASLGFFHPASLYYMMQNYIAPTLGVNKPLSHQDDYFNPLMGWYQKQNPYWSSPSSYGNYDPATDPWGGSR